MIWRSLPPARATITFLATRWWSCYQQSVHAIDGLSGRFLQNPDITFSAFSAPPDPLHQALGPILSLVLFDSIGQHTYLFNRADSKSVIILFASSLLQFRLIVPSPISGIDTCFSPSVVSVIMPSGHLKDKRTQNPGQYPIQYLSQSSKSQYTAIKANWL